MKMELFLALLEMQVLFDYIQAGLKYSLPVLLRCDSVILFFDSVWKGKSGTRLMISL